MISDEDWQALVTSFGPTREDIVALEYLASRADELWPLVAALDFNDREALLAGARKISELLYARGEEYAPQKDAPLAVWPKEPLSRQELIAWLALLVTLLDYIQGNYKDEPVPVQPPVEIVVELPEYLKQPTGVPDAPGVPPAQREAPVTSDTRPEPLNGDDGP